MRWAVSMACALVACLLVASQVSALTPYPNGSTGTDLSWPSANCAAQPSSKIAFAIIGVNGGLDFRPNPCLSQEVSRFNQNYSLYLNTGYPGVPLALRYKSTPLACRANDDQCLAYNWGYNDVLYSLQYASRLNVHTTHWWLDVETVNSWSNDPSVNVRALQGMLAALRTHSFLPTIGFYAYPGQWQLLTSNWKNDLPAWAATGSTKRNDALAACKELSFTGGPLLLSQYTLKLDADYVCRG